MKFSKFEALGNDFLIVAKEALPAHVAMAEFSRRICDRKLGAGADGLLVLGKPSNPGADLRMQIWNADGSEAEISGNGLRCAAASLMLAMASGSADLKVETGAGLRQLRLTERKGDTLVFRADMGVPILRSEEIPVSLSPAREICVNEPLEVGGQHLRATMTSMGNPHCSVFVDDFESIDWRSLGRQIEGYPLFPNRTNVEFIRVLDRNRIEVRFWERGVGETASSGTSACASAVASVLTQRTDRSLQVITPGGVILIEWRAAGPVMLEGPARLVFRGDWPSPDGGQEVVDHAG